MLGAINSFHNLIRYFKIWIFNWQFFKIPFQLSCILEYWNRLYKKVMSILTSIYWGSKFAQSFVSAHVKQDIWVYHIFTKHQKCSKGHFNLSNLGVKIILRTDFLYYFFLLQRHIMKDFDTTWSILHYTRPEGRVSVRFLRSLMSVHGVHFTPSFISGCFKKSFLMGALHGTRSRG